MLVRYRHRATGDHSARCYTSPEPLGAFCGRCARLPIRRRRAFRGCEVTEVTAGGRR